MWTVILDILVDSQLIKYLFSSLARATKVAATTDLALY